MQPLPPASRRQFISRMGAAPAALTWMLSRDGLAAPRSDSPRARRVVFLHQSGAPSQIELLDPKPELARREGQPLPEEIRQGQRLTTMTSQQQELSLVGSKFRFAKHGESGLEISELLPHTSQLADHLCVIRSMHTEAINHDPAVTFMHTGSEQPGRPSMGAWVSYALARETASLPDFVVMVSGGRPGDQPLSSRLWSAGFLPGGHAAMRLRGGRDPLLFLNNPPGVDPRVRRMQLDALADLNALAAEGHTLPQSAADARQAALQTRIDQYSRAVQLQELMPALTDVSDEPPATWRLYGEEARTPGTFAANCLRARRLLEQDVPFVQLYHRGWDHHEQIVQRLPIKCRETDRGTAALIADLRQRGLLEETLVVWAGEFGRTAYCQGALAGGAYGRDHHPRCFSIFMAGGGVRGGIAHGVTDELSYNVVADGVHVHDLQATILHLLGFDHQRLTYRTQGRDYRLTDQYGEVVRQILA